MKFLPTTLSPLKSLLLNSSSQLKKLAQKVGWLKRAPRKLTPICFVHSILLAVSQGEASLRLLATSIGLHRDDRVSKQALWERVGPEAVELFKAVLGDLLSKAARLSSQPLPNIEGVRRILVQDSTILNLHKKFSQLFPAGKNQHGVSAALRLQAVFDLISGVAIDLSLAPYLENDQSASGQILPLLRKGDLVIRDLGYFCATVFDQIARKSAYYITRHLGTRVLQLPVEKGGERLDLLAHFQRHAPNPGDVVDLDVVVGDGQKTYPRFACRLVARRVPEQVEAKRLRKVNQEDRKQQPGRRRSKRYKQLLGWEIYLTNLPADRLGVDRIAQLYRLRWRLEVIFKAVKSKTPLTALAQHRSNQYHVKVLILAWLCLWFLATATGSFALATNSIERGGALEPNCLSLLKVVPKIFRILNSVLTHSCASDPATLFKRLMAQSEYHDRYEKRKNRTNMAEMIGLALELS